MGSNVWGPRVHFDIKLMRRSPSIGFKGAETDQGWTGTATVANKRYANWIRNNLRRE